MILKWNLRKLGIIIDNITLGSLNCLENGGYLNTNKYTIMKFLQTLSIKWYLVTFFSTFANFRIPAVRFVMSAGVSAHSSTYLEQIGGLKSV